LIALYLIALRRVVRERVIDLLLGHKALYL